jgi:hypothetical protein
MGVSLKAQRMLGVIFVAFAYVIYSIPEPNQFSFNYETVANQPLGDLFSVIFLSLLVAGLLLIFRSYYSRVGRSKVSSQSESSQGI